MAPTASSLRTVEPSTPETLRISTITGAIYVDIADVPELMCLLHEATPPKREPENERPLMQRLQDIYVQAVRDQSHYYVGTVIKEAIVRIRNLERATKGDGLSAEDYQEALNSHLEHVRDLDIAMNGMTAAKRPLLIDIKGQLLKCIGIVNALSLFGGWTRWRHVKRRSEYTVVSHTARAQWASQPRYQIMDANVEEMEWTVYIGENGGIGVRPTDEFKDGRFEKID